MLRGPMCNCVSERFRTRGGPTRAAEEGQSPLGPVDKLDLLDKIGSIGYYWADYAHGYCEDFGKML